MPNRAQRELRAIYRELEPYAFQCVEGCTACCGPVPLAPVEAEALGVPGVVTPTRDDITCAYCNGCSTTNGSTGGCSVYDRRPFMCRIYGTIDGLRCPEGAGPARMMPPRQYRKLMKRYIALMEASS